MSDAATWDRALEEERAFIASLGGYTLEIAGARLVTHERIPVPRFNFAQEVRISAGRQAAFFERALDHYFQRALRPSFRVEEPVPGFLEAGFARFGFRRRTEPHTVLLAEEAVRPAKPSGHRIRRATESEVDIVAGFWTSYRERDEFRRALEVLWSRPNPDEQLEPLLALEDSHPVAAALLHRYRGIAAIHAVATQPGARGRGAATALVAEALRIASPESGPAVIHSDYAPLDRRLGVLGFTRSRRFIVYELPADARLELPSPGPPGPPRWRPPRQRLATSESAA